MPKDKTIREEHEKPRARPNTATNEKRAITESYARLIEAAARRGIVGELAISQALNYKDQSLVNNWQRRGVSKSGALDAEKFLKCSAVWILEGIDPFKE